MATTRCLSCMQQIEDSVCPHCGYPSDEKNGLHQLPVGTMLRNRYQVGKVLGQGGFGITYLAWDTLMQVTVAVKEFYPSGTVFRRNSESLNVECSTEKMIPHYEYCKERFLREASALVQFKDIPEIVDILDFLEENNTAYIIMEFVRGVDLAKYIQNRGGKLTVDETLRILDPVMDALATVHKGGIVHRDISPDNIILDPMGGAKLLDFGAVRAVENPDVEKGLNKSTEAILKHGFAPLEQYNTRGSLGPWTDEYAMCATIWYCLTGQIPEEASIRMSEGVDPDWASIPGLSEQQQNALKKGFSCRARDRFGDVAKLRNALLQQEPVITPVEMDPETEPVPPEIKSRKKPLIGVFITLICLAAVFLGYVFLNGQTSTGQRLGTPTSDPSMSVAAEAYSVSTEPETTEPETTLPETTEAETATEPETAPATEETAPAAAPIKPMEPWETNVMKFDPLSSLVSSKEEVLTVNFLDTLENMPNDSIDLSQAGDRTVLGWNSNGTITIAAEGGINAKNACENLFADCENLKFINFGDSFHTEYATSMANMFRRCLSLTTLDAAKLDTSSATTMAHMFDMITEADGTMSRYSSGNGILTNLGVGNWDVSNVKDMSYMFYGCETLWLVEAGKWNVSNVKDMKYMFANCEVLTSPNVDNWDVSNVTDMEAMFYGCRALPSPNVRNWNVSNVRDMTSLFEGCTTLRTVDVGSWDVSNVTNMDNMFSGCTALISLDVTNWDVGSVNSMSSMFSSCRVLHTLDVSKWNVRNVSNFNNMFYDCRTIKSLDVSNWDLSSALDMGYMFQECSALEKMDVSRWDVSNVRIMRYMFSGCAIKPLAVDGWDVHNVIDMTGMFSWYISSPVLDLSNWDISSLENADQMFYFAYSMTVNGISKWDLSGIKSYDKFASPGVQFDYKDWTYWFK